QRPRRGPGRRLRVRLALPLRGRAVPGGAAGADRRERRPPGPLPPHGRDPARPAAAAAPAGRGEGGVTRPAPAPPRTDRERMVRYIIHRLLLMIPTLLAISIMTFVIIQLPPGNYLDTLITELRAAGETADLQKVEFLRKQYGLDQPVWMQYGLWLTGLLHGDL